MSVVGSLSPLLFLPFRELYGISYSLLGLLVLVNFVTQLGIDLIFSFFSHKFNIDKTVKAIPLIAVFGFAVYVLSPMIFAFNVYVGLLIGTVIFSAASGLAEVLISPVIAALPSDNPDREMSKLHSVYAWGVVFVVLFSSAFLTLFGKEMWQILTVVLMLVPATSAILFFSSEIPKMQSPEKMSGVLSFLKNGGVWLFVLGIFLGGGSECTMAQWSSGYLEKALGLPKLVGDVFGVALFGAMLGLGRSLYASFGKNIKKVLFLGSLGAFICYLTAALSPFPIIGLVGCALTGFCVSMLWPGSLIAASDRYPQGGVVLFALMAAGGDLGASVGPQVLGLITDGAMSSSFVTEIALKLGMTSEQIGMKAGMLMGSLFPLIGTFLFLFIWKKGKK